MCIYLLKIQQTGAQLVKTDPLQTWVSTSISIGNITEVYWWDSGDKRSSDGLVVRAHMRYMCQNRPKTEAEHPPKPPGSFFHTKFCQQPSHMIFSQFALKKEHARTFGQIKPSAKFQSCSAYTHTHTYTDTDTDTDMHIYTDTQIQTHGTHINIHAQIQTCTHGCARSTILG